MDPSQSLHWTYGHGNASAQPPTGNGSTTWTSVPARPTKRTLSISESDDCEDVFSEDSKEQCTSPGDADSCQMLSRKKRRGVIEKKRRDRINTSLTELKLLVPSAFEKQGSAKLEKAEILQLTVDHLKMIHSKGLDSIAFDPHKFAMDYHNIGFRECATEVARYLITIEGMDIQDPLRLRLMSHLQSFAVQREIASKQAAGVAPWAYSTPTQNYTPHFNPLSASGSSVGASIVPNLTHPHQPPIAPSLNHNPNLHDLNSHFDISTSCAQSTAVPTSSDASSRHLSSTVLTPLTPVSAVSTTSAAGYHNQYNLNAFTAPGVNQHHPNYNQGNSSSQMKPYRPWGGAEVAY